jgi:hypothetical protein
LGQIEDASFRFAAPRFAGRPAAVSIALSAVEALTVEYVVELRIELMSGVVAQIQSREKIIVP